MAKYKVKTAAVIDNNPVGSTIELPKATAENLFAKGYVDIIEEVKPKVKPKRKAPAKKKATKATANKKTATKKKAETKAKK